MLIPKKIVAFASNESENNFFITLKTYFNYLFSIQIITDISTLNHADFDGSFAFHDIETSIPHLVIDSNYLAISQTNSKTEDNDIKTFSELSKTMTEFHYMLNFDLFNHLPYRFRLHNKDGQTIYSNHKPEDPFDIYPEEEYPIDKWVQNSLIEKKAKELHLLLPGASQDYILVQSYKRLENDSGQLVGYIEHVHNIKPLLEGYLKESGQAIVGWSDVTSGASISNDDFEL